MILGDKSSYGVAEVNSIRLRMYDGRVLILTDVHHVSDLRRNIVSLRYLEEKGFIFRSDLGVLNVSKDNKIMMRRKRLRSCLYQMERYIMYKEAEVIASAMEDRLEVQSI